jgi:hypothetical protein
MMPTKKLEAIAYHEAGHGVIAYLLSRPFVHVSIIPDPDDENLGHIRMAATPKSLHPDYESNARTERWIRREIMIELAGPLAEKLQRGKGNWRGASGDFHRAFDMACYHTCGEAETSAYIHWLWERTKTLLTLNWPAVEVLAAELLKRKVVGAKRARTLMRKVMHDWAHRHAT